MAAVPSQGRAARVERSAAPESDATRDLYERFSGQIFGYCFHQLGSREEAEDAVQTTFMNALRGLQRGIIPKIESAWLFKIAHNVCLSRRRSSARRGRVEAPNNLEVLQEVVPAREQMGDELIRLQDALERMPESQRRAILLREWQGLSYREIGRELGLSQSAVETLIFRARRSLASGLAVEPAQWGKRARRGLDAGGVLAAAKALLTGGTGAKVAATIAIATTAAVAAASGHHHVVRHVRVPLTHASSPEVAKTQAVPAHAAPIRIVPQHVTATTQPKHVAVRHVSVASAPAAPSTPPAAPSSDPVQNNGKAGDPNPQQQVAAPATPSPGAKHGKGYGHGKHAKANVTLPPAQSEPPTTVSDQQVTQDQTPPPAAQEGDQHGHGNGHG